MEKMVRKNGKWAKVSGHRGKWAVAKGWADEISARPNHVFIYTTKDGAMIAATYWIND